MLKVSASGLVPVTYGRSADLNVGQWVIVVGNALALPGGPTASLGIVSALNRTITTSGGTTLTGLIQTDAGIEAGDSGGPLVDANGHVVGINTAGASGAPQIGFAIPIDEAIPILSSLSS